MASTAVVAWVLWAAAVSTGVTTVNAQVEMTEVDYVIVGGGTAGCVLAARLCEGLPQAKIAMVERAPPRSEEAVCTSFLCAVTEYFSRIQCVSQFTSLRKSNSATSLGASTLPSSCGHPFDHPCVLPTICKCPTSFFLQLFTHDPTSFFRQSSLARSFE